MRYTIEGDSTPVVICELAQDESMITEKGAMSWMSPNMEMKTSSNGGIGKMFGRMLSGESMFQNVYTARDGNGMIAFASCFPGQILPYDVRPEAGLIVQKSAFLAAESSVRVSAFFQKKFSAGLFGGEGFVMQRLSGQGTAFLEIDGAFKKYTLAPGQSIVLDTGYLAAMSESCKMEIKSVPGVKNMLFGGEGVFNTWVTGPGDVWIQTMPIGQMAAALRPFFPST